MSKSQIDRHKHDTEKIPNVISWLRDDYTDSNRLACVYLIVYLNNKRIRFNTGVKIDPVYWDAEKREIKKTHPKASDFNLIINNCRSKLNNIFVKYRLRDRELTPEIIKAEYLRPSRLFDFCDWMEVEIERRRGLVTDSTVSQFRAHMEKLRGFRQDILFADLNEDLFDQFNKHMKSTLKNEANTRFNTLKTIRTFINIARRQGIIDHNPLYRMPVKRAQTDRSYLDESEVKILLELYRSLTLPDNYQRVLRHFLFSCFTGLRISDLRLVRHEDLIGDTLVLIPHKTKNTSRQTIRIPLTKTAKLLIRDENPFRIQGPIFECYSEQKMREFLRDIIPHAKIQKKIKFHAGRHTFATIFLKKTKNLAALQKLLGHQNINQTMIYAHMIREDLQAEMEIFDDFTTGRTRIQPAQPRRG